MASGPPLVALDCADPAPSWVALGFAVAPGRTCRIGATKLALRRPAPEEAPRTAGDSDRGGLVAWTLGAEDGPPHVDGIATRWVTPPPATAAPAHPNGAVRVDHVVVATPDVGRTIAALEAVGMVLRRQRAGGTPERPLRQAFFRHGEALVEVVGPPQAGGDGPARLWGLTVAVADLDAVATRLGPALGAPRDAVQPGRRIATVRRAAGLGTPLALMDDA